MLKHVLSTSFYVDCSNSSWPEGLEPPIHCPESGCRSHSKECAHVKRALANSYLSKSFPMFCKEQAIVHYTDADFWKRCCIYTKKGWDKRKMKPIFDHGESSTCVIMYEKPMPPLPRPPKSAPKGILAKLSGLFVKLLNMSARCGSSLCGSTGEYPEPVCLAPSYEDVGFLAKKCVWWGKNNELHSMDPVQGQENYAVYQFGTLPPLAAILAQKAAEIVASRQTQREKFFIHQRCKPLAISDFL